MNTLIDKAKQIKCLITDVDGVLTNGLLYIDNHGNELKAFSVLDGMGLKLLMCADIYVAVITTSVNAVIQNRMKQLGIEHFYTGQVNKEAAYADIMQKLNLTPNQVAYIGDDLPDLSLIKKVGLGVAVANAVSAVKEFAAWETTKSGGEGAVRELCDLILKAQGKEDSALARYLAV